MRFTILAAGIASALALAACHDPNSNLALTEDAPPTPPSAASEIPLSTTPNATPSQATPDATQPSADMPPGAPPPIVQPPAPSELPNPN